MSSDPNGTDPRPRLAIVAASTRPGRQGFAVAEWFRDEAEKDGAFDIDFIDLAQVNLPLLDEANHPRLQQYEHDHTKAWSARVTAADAFVFVTPEYDHSLPAALLNALQFLSLEWHYKTAAVVSYGGVSAGLRSAQTTRSVLSALKMFPIPEAVSIPFFTQFIDDGVVQPNEVMVDSAKAVLKELAKVDAALRPLRG
jgi:NAD(P)H-dependent FMN reductase